jgi:hypothetical protein
MHLRRLSLVLLLVGCGGAPSGAAEVDSEGTGGQSAVGSGITPAPAGDELLAALIESEVLALRGDNGPAMEAAFQRAVAAAAALGMEDAEYAVVHALEDAGELLPMKLGLPYTIAGQDPASRCAQARLIAWEHWRGDSLADLTPAQRQSLGEIRARLEREPVSLARDSEADRALIAAGRDGLLDDLRRECRSFPRQWDLGLAPADLLRVAALVRGDLRATGDLAGPFRLIHGIREHTERVADAADWERVLAHHRSETDVGMGFTIQVPERELDDAAYEALSEEEIEALGQLREGDVLCEDRCCAIRGDIALQHGGGLYLAGACWVPTPAGKRLSRILFLDGM